MITIDMESRHPKAIIFDGKSYVLANYNSTDLIIKGNTLISRSNEKYITNFIKKGIQHLMDETPEKIKDEYDYWKFRIEQQLMTVDLVKKRQSLNMSLESYQNKKMSDSYPHIAQYEAALTADKLYIKGDVIETWNEEPEAIIKKYKTVPDKKVVPSKPAYEVIRLANNFNCNIYRDHYLDRLEKGTKKFLVVLGWKQFEKMFPNISLNMPEQKKMIGVWGYDKFIKEFPDYNWKKSDYKGLNEQEQQKFARDASNENIKINFELA